MSCTSAAHATVVQQILEQDQQCPVAPHTLDNDAAHWTSCLKFTSAISPF